MKFSIIFEAQLANPTPAREHQLIHDCITQAVYAEEVGFDGVWAVEHHGLKRYAHMSAPEIFLTAVASRTKRIRIGHGVVCMAFNYNFPTRVAERAAMLDIICNGRLQLGAGRGGTAQEAALCNVDRDQTKAQVEEALKIIASAWDYGDEGFSWKSDLISIQAPPGNTPLEIVPSPVQRPHPPFYLACNKPDTLVHAAEMGVGALAFGFGGIDAIKEQRDVYWNAVANRTGKEFVSKIQNNYMSALCPTIVLDDREKAREVGTRGQRFFAESARQWAAPNMPLPAENTEGIDNRAFMAEQRAIIEEQMKHDKELATQRSLLASFNTNHAYGTADDAIAYVEQLEAVGLDEVMCLIQMGTVPQDVCIETLRQWGEHVIPHFRRKRKAS